MSPDSAHWSGRSARRVVVPVPRMTSQSSNSAPTAGPARPVKVIVLGGPRDFFANGIHLNVIQAADDPRAES